MTRPFGVQGHKRKRRQKNYDRKEFEQSVKEEGAEQLDEGETTAVSMLTQDKEEKLGEDDGKDLPGIPVAPLDQTNKPGAIFILEKASLEVAKVGKTYQILNSEDHAHFLRKNNKNPADYRPDIAHQALLMILDSPINKAGRVRAVYVRTDKGVLFEVKPYVRIPRTYKRFAGIMLQLLQKLSITAVGQRGKLMRVIKNPVTQYLPLNSHKIGFSYSSEKLVEFQNYIAPFKDDINFVFMVGAMAHGKIDEESADDYISISGYPLSAAWCIADICKGLALKWKIA